MESLRALGLVAAVLPWFLLIWMVGRRWAPAWPRELRLLGASGGGVVAIVLDMEILGTAGILRWYWLLATAALALLGSALVRRGTAEPAKPARGLAISAPVREPRLAIVAMAVALAAVAVRWTAGMLAVLRTGITATDSLDYHLTYPALWAQTGSLRSLHPFGAGDGTAFHPFSVELLHALGMIFLRNDLLSVVINAAFVTLALGAAWVLGRRFEAGAIAVTGTAVLLAAPLVVRTQPGTGDNDVAAAALLLTAVALAAHVLDGRRARLPAVALVGAIAGLSVGSKLTMPAPALAFLACLVVFPLGVRAADRVWRGGVLLVAGFVGGAYFYLRDWVLTGSPVPSAHLTIAGIGFPKPSTPVADAVDQTVAQYLGDGHVVRGTFVPMLHVALGTAWPIMAFAPIAVGLLVVLWPRVPGVARAAGVAVVLGTLAYLVTPTTAGGTAGNPVLFVVNTRYLIPEWLLGWTLVAALPWVRHRRANTATCAVLCALTLLPLSNPRLWPLTLVGHRLTAIIAVAVVAALAACWVIARRAPHILLPLALLGTVLATTPAAGYYLHRRYAHGGHVYANVYAWARGVHDARIGFVGFPEGYPLYGPHLNNTVDYVGRPTPHGGYADYPSCETWRAALARAGYRYVVTFGLPWNGQLPAADGWTRTDPSAQLVNHGPFARVYRMDGSPTSSGCGA
jgi:hypothetical protein